MARCRIYDRIRRKHPRVKLEPDAFKLQKGQKTHPPIIVSYQVHGHGTLASTADRGIHYTRLRPFIGRSDPVLPGIVPHRRTLASDLATGERREIERALWENLFRYPPTHVLRLGWVSRATGAAHDILYLPLNFNCPGFSSKGLAKDCGLYLVDCLQRCSDRPLLLPTSKIIYNPITGTNRTGIHFAAMFWLAQVFYHYKDLTVERPALRWLT